MLNLLYFLASSFKGFIRLIEFLYLCEIFNFKG